MYALDDVAADAAAFRQAVAAGQAYKPLYVKIKLVWTCNLRCGMCHHWRWQRQAPLALDRLKSAIDELAELGCRKIHLSGGEPTIHPHLGPLIHHINQHNIRVTMTTNATLITRPKAEMLAEAGLRGVNVSIDSPDPHLHDRIRGVKGAWKRAVKGLKVLRKEMKKGKVRINTVVGRLNYNSLLALPDLAADWGVDFLNLIPLDEHTGDLQRLSKRQIQDYNERIAPVLAEKALAWGLMQDAQQAYPFGLTAQEARFSKNGLYARGYYEQQPCFAPWTHALIDHMGRVTVCCMLREAPVLGDLRQQSFHEIWTGAAYTALRTGETLPLFATCRRCDDFLAQNRRLAAIAQPEPSQ